MKRGDLLRHLRKHGCTRKMFRRRCRGPSTESRRSIRTSSVSTSRYVRTRGSGFESPRPPSAFQPSRCTGGGTPSGPLIAPALLGALVTPFLIAWWAFVPFIALAWTFGQMSYRCQREAIRELALVNPTAYKFLLLDGIIVVDQTAQQERSSGLR